MLTILIYGIIAILVLFIAAGAATLVTSMLRYRGEGAPGGRPQAEAQSEPHGAAGQNRRVRGALHDYVGPVEPRHALLTGPARVAVEFVAAIFGFPGLGWLITGRVMTGLVLLVAGPSFVWGAFPAYLVVSGRIADDPYLVARYLPLLALLSAGALTIHHLRRAPGPGEAA